MHALCCWKILHAEMTFVARCNIEGMAKSIGLPLCSDLSSSHPTERNSSLFVEVPRNVIVAICGGARLYTLPSWLRALSALIFDVAHANKIPDARLAHDDTVGRSCRLVCAGVNVRFPRANQTSIKGQPNLRSPPASAIESSGAKGRLWRQFQTLASGGHVSGLRVAPSSSGRSVVGPETDGPVPA